MPVSRASMAYPLTSEVPGRAYSVLASPLNSMCRRFGRAVGLALAACSVAFCACSSLNPPPLNPATYGLDAGSGAGPLVEETPLMSGRQTYGNPSSGQGQPMRGPLSPSAWDSPSNPGGTSAGGGLPGAGAIKLP